MRKKEEGKTSTNQSYDTLLKLLPGLVAAFPAFTTMLGEQGAQGDLNQIVRGLPEIVEKLRETDDETLQDLYNHLTEVIPGIEDMLPRRKGE